MAHPALFSARHYATLPLLQGKRGEGTVPPLIALWKGKLSAERECSLLCLQPGAIPADANEALVGRTAGAAGGLRGMSGRRNWLRKGVHAKGLERAARHVRAPSTAQR